MLLVISACLVFLGRTHIGIEINSSYVCSFILTCSECFLITIPSNRCDNFQRKRLFAPVLGPVQPVVHLSSSRSALTSMVDKADCANRGDSLLNVPMSLLEVQGRVLKKREG